jgi:hypothetical protein
VFCLLDRHRAPGQKSVLEICTNIGYAYTTLDSSRFFDNSLTVSAGSPLRAQTCALKRA